MTDRERVADISRYIHGPGGSGAWRQLLYAFYVAALLGSFYFFTTARALALAIAGALPESQPWMWAALGLGAVPVAVVATARAGRRVGPVTAPLPWVDLVVASPLDRAVSLREHWLIKTVALTGGGFLAGVMIGGALWAAGLGGATALVAGALIGLSAGLLCATTWLAGQAHADPLRDKVGPRELILAPREVLRRLSLPHVRAHSLRLLQLTGALYMGDTRVAQLLLSTTPSRGRRWRLRSRGPMRTVVSRDLLGLRRNPTTALTSLALTAVGTLVLAHSLAHRLPVAITVAAMVVFYLGCSRGSEGLRSFGDVLAAPSVFGLSLRRQALAHSVAPALLSLAAWLPCALAHAAISSGPALSRLLLALGCATLVSIGAQWVTAFRVSAPDQVYFPETGPVMLVVWWFRPLVIATAAGTGLATRIVAAQPGSDPLLLLLSPVLILVGIGWLAHRALAER